VQAFERAYFRDERAAIHTLLRVRVARYICGPKPVPFLVRYPATHVFMHFPATWRSLARIRAYARRKHEARIGLAWTMKENNTGRCKPARRRLDFFERGRIEETRVRMPHQGRLQVVVRNSFPWIGNQLSWLLPDTLAVLLSLHESHIYSLHSIRIHLRYDLLGEGVPGGR